MSAAIGVALVLEIAVPLSYYVGAEPADERFAWRMFSSRSQRTCEVSVEVARAVRDSGDSRDTRDWIPVSVRELVGNAWLGSLRHAQPRVVEALLALVCAGGDARAARFDQRCLTPNGDTLPAQRRVLECGGGEMRSEGAAP